MTQNTPRKGPPPAVYALGLMVLGGLGYGAYQLMGQSNGSDSVSNNSSPAAGSSDAKPNSGTLSLKSSRGADYSDLQDDLAKKKWKRANEDTTELLLKAFGPKSEKTGNVDSQEALKPPCDELKTVDQLWSQASSGTLGFTAQRQVVKDAGGDYKAAYNKMQWQKPAGEWLIQYQSDGHRNTFKSGYEPDYGNPDKGHLPTFERGYNFSYSFDGTLAKCGL